MRYLVLVLSVVFFVGCAGMATMPKKPVPQAEYKKEKIKNYNINIQQSSFVGNEVVKKGYMSYVKKTSIIYKALENIIEGENGAVVYRAENEYIPYQTGINSKGIKWYAISNKNMQPKYEYYAVALDDNGVVIYSGFPTFKKNQYINKKLFDKEYAITKEYTKDSFMYEIIYNGVENNTITLTYREFKNDMARPAFFQNLKYDLKTSNTIRYKNFKLKIHSADNEKIIYTVLED